MNHVGRDGQLARVARQLEQLRDMIKRHAAVGSVTAIYVDYIFILRRLALCTGVPVRRLKDWRTLGMLILFAALAAAIAWTMVDRYLAAGGALVRLIVGGALLAAVYAAMAAWVGIGRGWFAAIRDPEHGI